MQTLIKMDTVKLPGGEKVSPVRVRVGIRVKTGVGVRRGPWMRARGQGSSPLCRECHMQQNRGSSSPTAHTCPDVGSYEGDLTMEVLDGRY